MKYLKIFYLSGWIDRAKENFTLIPTNIKFQCPSAFMRMGFLFSTAVALIFILAPIITPAQRFGGQAAAVRSTITVPLLPVSTAAVADTGPLPSAGGSIQFTSTGVSVPNVLTVGSSSVLTQGSGNGSQSTASANNLNINVLGNTITADVVSSTTNCSCPTSACTGNFAITNLQINGSSVVVTGAVNQTINLAGGVGTLVINEQITSPNSITLNALHLFVTDPVSLTTTDVVAVSAHSDITCIAAPPANLYSGRATDVRLTQTDSVLGSVVGTIIADTGYLPTSGGAISATTAGAGQSPLLTTGTVTADTSGGLPGGNINTSQSNASVKNLAINALNVVTINARLLTSNTQCSCNLNVGTCGGNSVVTNLLVTALGLPVPIIITGQPNQLVVLPANLGSIVINEQTNAGSADLTVNALHVNLNVSGLAATDIVIASSHSDISCAAAPTAADVSVSGRVTNAAGNGVPGALVKLTNMSGEVQTVLTNAFGYYRFENIQAGEVYIASASHKRYRFPTRTISVDDEISNADFVSIESETNR